MACTKGTLDVARIRSMAQDVSVFASAFGLAFGYDGRAGRNLKALAIRMQIMRPPLLHRGKKSI